VIGQNLKLAVGSILELVKIGILNLQPAWAHDILPENELFKKSSVATKDVRICLTGSVGVDFRLWDTC
jgi:hypothetical protein